MTAKSKAAFCERHVGVWMKGGVAPFFILVCMEVSSQPYTPATLIPEQQSRRLYEPHEGQS